MTDNIYVQETVFEVDVTCGDVVVVGTPGVTGERGTIEIGTVTTVAPDQPATVENIGTVSDAILDFEIPRGSDVSVGTVSPTTYSTDAPQISDSGANGDVVLDFTLPRAATVSVGDTDTVAPLSEASVINSGSNGDVVLNFEIPRGSLVSVGTTSTVEYGVPASVTNSGVDGDSILNFSIPSGPISKVTEIRGRTTLDYAVDTVAINISGFTETTDILYVFVNSIYVSQGQDYTVSGANIVRSSGTWAVGTVIDFVCLRSILIPIESFPETIGNTPIPDSGNYFTTDTINGAFQQVGSQLAQKPNEISGLDGTLDLTGGQIKFPATQSASSDPNTLDDYEEGTFTPTIIGTTVNGTGTYTTQTGRYTKIGKIIQLQILMVWTAHTGSGNMRVAGLPFSSEGISPLSIYHDNIALSASNQLFAYTSSWYCIFGQVPVGGGSVAFVPLDTAGSVYLCGVYQVA